MPNSLLPILFGLLVAGCAATAPADIPPREITDPLRGAYRSGPDRIVAIEYLPEKAQLSYLDYGTGRFGALYARAPNEFVAGPGALLKEPVEITVRFERESAGPAPALRWKEGTEPEQRLTRIAFHEVGLRWKNDDVQLSGTLILPEGTGPYPAIVLTHTSSDAPRRSYRKEALFFATRGFAALVYDKRGVGASTGDWRHTLQQLAGDASAAVELLARRADIDVKRIGVWGQSQGGWVAPLTASINPRVAFVIAQSAPTVTPAEQEIFRVEHNLRADGFASEQLARAVAYQKALMRWILTGEGRDELAPLIQEAASAPWADYVAIPNADPLPEKARDTTIALYAYDPRPALLALKVPTLFLFGAVDSHVPVASSRVELHELFATTGFRNYRIAVLPRAAHGFWETDRDGRTHIAKARRWAPGYWKTLGDWLAERKRR